ncbi:hypothetical protein BJV85_000240 [Clostridium acetobutylicum]|uniref:Uncharacterized protein, homolog of Desulfovibrio gigas (Gi:6978031) n=1 Tax=Clostridium acetobutylicum (strain ATCC 824 / DSM 792 / JCM 1419 / IAM 19013 / LMG 5710 / NBRC 13948 / NRRL B-527 / VKM B-1787 / 2291 / W) TaxID=272562 RepID=Q97D22_CLOAB|nr:MULTISPECIES: hypothetical protein [Clostridium]AAK81582.1 Uncharacterized protein, homolog of Desulfovibrio gigas (gi:6978031) [Clostridium acetobutylicum ATCC 824]ADZ22704.1 Conserved hypothetical protein [Clostridium acetobutylicum EA 2018]AEI32977.1 hypothetical protein SMB_G3701 [Clostridium acetobutylicum DSM 1731]AWV80744.1 hypothetical protein DK921_11660 [Clostridium acetobutylicum]MBC2393931.1 hypothetical protein [Clostridium acetobutylicum]
METIIKNYSLLKGIIHKELYDNGNIKSFILDKKNELPTNYGTLIPQYDSSYERRKYIDSVSFYKSGKLKSIYLQNQTTINTPIGKLPSELITFYENGALKRVFPLNGKLGGYWSEQDEYSLAEDTSFNLKVGSFNKKIINVYFYNSGNLKSITFWPKNTPIIDTPIGKAEVRIGLSLYENGCLKSFEPNKPLLLQTPIGKITAYDSNASGINGDLNSVNFYECGDLKSLVTSSDKVTITSVDGKKTVYEPGLRLSIIDNKSLEVIPLNITFYDNKVQFNNSKKDEYDITASTFTIEHLSFKQSSPCTNCSK